MPTHAVGSGLVSTYISELRARHFSRALRTHVERVVPRLCAFLHAKRIRDIRRVDEALLVSFVRHLIKSQSARGGMLAPASQAAYLNTLKGFFAFLERRGWILRNPALVLALPRVKHLPKAVLNEREAEALVDAPSAATALGRRDRALLELLYGTGIRVGECECLDLIDLDLEARTLLIRNGKGMRDRVVPLTVRAAAALDFYLRESRHMLLRRTSPSALWLARGGRRLQLQSIRRLVQVHARAARIKRRISPHALRHACATHLLRGGADIRHVQALLGHKSLETTARYTQVEIRDLRSVVRRAHPRERLRRYNSHEVKR